MTAMDAVVEVLELAKESGTWLTPYEIEMHIARKYGSRYSDSCITARIRDLRKSQYGAHRVSCRKRDTSSRGFHSRSFEYRLEG